MKTAGPKARRCWKVDSKECYAQEDGREEERRWL